MPFSRAAEILAQRRAAARNAAKAQSPEGPERVDVMFFETFREEAQGIHNSLRKAGVVLSCAFTPLTVQEYCPNAVKPPAPIISTRTQSIIPTSWAPHLRGIISRCTGWDSCALLAKRFAEAGDSQTTQTPVAMGYLPVYCTRAVAEQALTMWMALLRRLPEQLQHFKAFDRTNLTGSEAEGKVGAVFGVGNIGYQVARIMRGLGMKVMGVDIVRKHADIDYVTPEHALAEADIIVCAMNLTDITRNYFTDDKLHLTKRGAIFVNVSRGEISPARYLLPLIKIGHLRGVGLDVYNDESELSVLLRQRSRKQRDSDGDRTTSPGLPADYDLSRLARSRAVKSEDVKAVLEMSTYSNVILTPHNAFNTEEAVQRKAEQTAQQLVTFLNTGEFVWKAPVPQPPAEKRARL